MRLAFQALLVVVGAVAVLRGVWSIVMRSGIRQASPMGQLSMPSADHRAAELMLGVQFVVIGAGVLLMSMLLAGSPWPALGLCLVLVGFGIGFWRIRRFQLDQGRSSISWVFWSAAIGLIGVIAIFAANH
jgi:hypothetical protein